MPPGRSHSVGLFDGEEKGGHKMKKKIFLTVLAVSIVALLIGGVVSAFYADESERVPITAQAAEIGVTLEGPPIVMECLFPGDCAFFDRLWQLDTSCCPVPIFAKPLVEFCEPLPDLADNVMCTVKFDQGGVVIWVANVPVSDLAAALEAHPALPLPCCMQMPLHVTLHFVYPETGLDQSDDMGDLIEGNLYVKIQTVPF